MTTLEQQFGVNAVGAMVAREFGDGIIYHGAITSFKRGKDGESDLYRVEYEDGDAEDMDCDEYNFAYALELSDQGWVVEEGGGASKESDNDREGNRDTWKPSKVISKSMSRSLFLLSFYFCVCMFLCALFSSFSIAKPFPDILPPTPVCSLCCILHFFVCLTYLELIFLVVKR